MKSRWIVPLLIVGVMGSASIAIAAEKAEGEKKFAATCPVSGQPANEKAVYKTDKDLNVYFCCDKCPVAYKQDPAKFAHKVGQQLLETGQIVQVGCPVCGKPIGDKLKAKVGHAEVAFCCKECQAKYDEADDDQKLQMAFGDLKKSFTRQTKCPVSGQPINPTAVAEHDGKKVYFCCPNCPKAFAADPEKFKTKLPQLADKDEGLPAAKK